MSVMTTEERKWAKQLNALIKNCPSTRIGFYTIGDPQIGLYDCSVVDAKVMDDLDDLVDAIQLYDASFEEVIHFPRAVDGVCG